MARGMTGAVGLPPEAFAAALAALPPATIHRLGALLRHHSPEEAWQVVLGRAPAAGTARLVLDDPRVGAWFRTAARSVRPADMWAECRRLGLQVLVIGHDGYPDLLADDPQPPPVLFCRGSLDLLEGRRVAVVGTRNATAAGRQSARSIAEGLASAGVHVVSGLARGIDGVAHRAVLAARAAGGAGRPIAVVGSGLDVVYPREHGDLWEQVAAEGVLLSEAPPGSPPEPYRFPLRNRIVAALSEVVVVVESRERGGSLITVDAAVERGVPVMAVPGSAANRAASGSNSLLRDGAAPVLDAGDVLTQLQLDHSLMSVPGRAERRRRPRREDEAVYRVLRDEPRTIDGVALLTGMLLVEAAMSLARLEADGWVAQADGWFEAVGSPL
ncbi:MAG: DNA-processing protein DprA [Ilumatobacteraceae bacterium]